MLHKLIPPCRLLKSLSSSPRHRTKIFRNISLQFMEADGNFRKLQYLTPASISHNDTRYYHRKRSTSSNETTSIPNANRIIALAEEIVSKTPIVTKPYLQLMRMDKPIGTWLLFWPCGWSIAMAAGQFVPDLYLMFLFGTGAFFMRGAGCAINDMWDKDFDCKVARTKTRPLANGQLHMVDALGCLSGALGISLCVLLQLNWYSILLGASSLAIVIVYPVMKRFTNWPQVTLGMAFNWGTLLGWSAVHGSCDWSVCLPLYFAGISWTLIYDTIYAHQDKADDILIGVKSTALAFENKTKRWLSLFSALMVSNLTVAGIFADQTLPYYLSVAAAAFHLAKQIVTVDLDNSEDCRKKFLSNRHIGLFIFLGIVLGNLTKP